MYSLPTLPYKANVLEPIISEKIMKLHHGKHHAGYVAKVNDALKDTEWADKPIEEVLKSVDELPKDKQSAVRNNGGGHANHSLFWSIMRKPSENNEPTGAIKTALERAFGSVEEFKKEFSEAGATQFGSGWAWLVQSSDNVLKVYSTPNQDSPYINGDTPLLGLDVWEHAYYLDYLNDRGAYIEKWWQVVNWDAITYLS